MPWNGQQSRHGKKAACRTELPPRLTSGNDTQHRWTARPLVEVGHKNNVCSCGTERAAAVNGSSAAPSCATLALLRRQKECTCLQHAYSYSRASCLRGLTRSPVRRDWTALNQPPTRSKHWFAQCVHTIPGMAIRTATTRPSRENSVLEVETRCSETISGDPQAQPHTS